MNQQRLIMDAGFALPRVYNVNNQAKATASASADVPRTKLKYIRPLRLQKTDTAAEAPAFADTRVFIEVPAQPIASLSNLCNIPYLVAGLHRGPCPAPCRAPYVIYLTPI